MKRPTDRPQAVARALAALGPFEVLKRLNLPHKRERRSARLLCPFHSERTPSATFAIGPEGTLRLHCFGACGRTWDVLHLVAQVEDLDPSRQFPQVMDRAAALAGVHLPSYEATPSPWTSLPPSPPPPATEVQALWQACQPVRSDGEVRSYLERRAITPDLVDRRALGRALPVGFTLPGWAKQGTKPWSTSGHRLLLPAFDATGALRSLRARLVIEAPNAPKVLVPEGHSTNGFIMACPVARQVLATGRRPPTLDAAAYLDVVVAEGEPDWLTWASRAPEPRERLLAVIGIFNHAWSEAHAARLPDGCRVAVRTHRDAAGVKYVAYLRHTLAARLASGTVRVFVPKEAPDAETP